MNPYDLCPAKPGDLIVFILNFPSEDMFAGDVALFLGIDLNLKPITNSYSNQGYGHLKFLINGKIFKLELFLNANGITDSRHFFEKYHSTNTY